jgi:hypothetical protein
MACLLGCTHVLAHSVSHRLALELPRGTRAVHVPVLAEPHFVRLVGVGHRRHVHEHGRLGGLHVGEH